MDVCFCSKEMRWLENELTANGPLLYSVRKKGKTITLLAFLLVMATLMLTCLSIQSATETANANIKKALLGYFTV